MPEYPETETYVTPTETHVDAPVSAPETAATPDPFGGTTLAPVTDDTQHDGAAYEALKNDVNAKAVAAIDAALDAVKKEFDALKVQAGHEATSMVRATLSYVLATLKAEAAHVRRVIVP